MTKKEEQTDQYAEQYQYNDTNVKLQDIEEKISIIKDRILLIGENLVSEKQETEKTFSILKSKIIQMQQEINRLKTSLQSTIENQENLVRKSELKILEKQFEMFQPLELARITDVKEMINQALKNKKQTK